MEDIENFSVYTKHKSLAFSAAHFICHKEIREYLHGHNYRVGLYVQGSQIDPATGYIQDFVELETPLKEIVETIKGKLMVPLLSETIQITDDETSITMVHGKSRFVIPKEDCALLEIRFSSVEELSKWMTHELIKKVGKENLLKNKIKMLRIDIHETDDRMASYAYKLE